MTSIKVINGRQNGQSDVRRLKVDNWDDAVSQIQSRFNLQGFTAKYKDEDGDHVTISTEDDFQEALAEAKGILRVLLGNVQKAAPSETKRNPYATPEPVSTATAHDNGAGAVDIEDSVLVEPVEESIEPKVEEPEEVQPVVVESEEDASVQQEQATVEAVDADVVEDASDKTDTDVHVNEYGEIELESEQTGSSDEPSAPSPKPTFFESLFRGLEGQQSSNGEDPIAQMAGSMAQEVMPGIMESLMGNLANMEVPEDGATESADSCECSDCNKSSCECSDDCAKEAKSSDASESRAAPEAPKDERVHVGIMCDVCDKTIVGNRYKCRACHNFDLCEPCLQSKGHDESHPLVLFRLPRAPRGFWNNNNNNNDNNNNDNGKNGGCPRRPRPHGRWHAPPHHQHFGPGPMPCPPHMQHGGPPRMFGGPPPPPHAFGMGMGFGPFEVNPGHGPGHRNARRNRRGPPAHTPAAGAALNEPVLDPLSTFMNAMFAQQGRGAGTGSGGCQAKTKTADAQSKASDDKRCTKSRRCEKKENPAHKYAEASTPTKSTEKAPVVAEKTSETEKVPTAPATPSTPVTPQEEFVVVESVPDVEDVAPTKSATPKNSSTNASADASGASTPQGKGKEAKNVDIMKKLYEMGFTDRSLNAAYIRMYGTDVSEIANRLAERR